MSFFNNPDVIRADELLETRMRGPKPVQDIVLVKSEELTINDPDFEKKVRDITASVLGLSRDGVGSVESAVNFYIISEPSLVSKDEHTTIIPIVMAGDLDHAVAGVEDVLEIVREENGREGFEVYMVGEASVLAESKELATSDIEQGERFSVPVALIILLVLFQVDLHVGLVGRLGHGGLTRRRITSISGGELDVLAMAIWRSTSHPWRPR